MEAMTINETSFFRDALINEAIPKLILPKTLYRNRQEKRLRIWSAACSTGQEPYSLAMQIVDYLPDLRAWDIEIIASDISSDALEKAKAGSYSLMEINRGLPASKIARHFSQHGLDWEISPAIKKMVKFERINLAKPIPAGMPYFDIILLRNVMIYFSEQDKHKLIAQLYSKIRPQGYLLLGATESIHNPERFDFAPVFKSDYNAIYQAQ